MTDLYAGLEAEARSLIIADQEAGHSKFETLSALLYATAVQAQACGVGPDVVASDLANLIATFQPECHQLSNRLPDTGAGTTLSA